MTTTIEAAEAQGKWLELLTLAKAGNEIIIAEESRPVARLTGVEGGRRPIGKRIPGLHLGMATISDDFDEPLPDEFWLGTA